MEQKKFVIWQDHSRHYLEMAYRSDRREKIEHPDGYGKRTGECGDTVEKVVSMSIRLKRIIAIAEWPYYYVLDINSIYTQSDCHGTVAMKQI